MERDKLDALLAYYDDTAAHYPGAIEPAFGPLARLLAEEARLRPGERVLDVGTGSGLVARYAAERSRFVVGMDFSGKMLHAARQQGAANLIRGNMHRLSFAAECFDVCLAGFAFNSTDPRQTMREAWRILKPGGRLVFTEWGLRDPLSDLVSDTMIEYMVEHPPPALEAQREALNIALPWDALENGDDVTGLLRETGFDPVELAIISPQIKMESATVFIQYKLAWPPRRAELAAMPDEVQRLCISELQEALESQVTKTGRLIWQPNIICVHAWKPGLAPND